MKIHKLKKSYLNVSGNVYDSEYINLTNIKDNRIAFDERTLFLSEDEKNFLNSQEIKEYNNVIYIFKYRQAYGIICDIPISEYKNNNIKCHELVIPETIQGMISNLHGYNCEAAPTLLGHINIIDYKKYIEEQLYDEKYDLGEIEIYVLKGEVADKIIEEFKEVECLYVADGHHRLYTTSISNLKSDNLACLISFKYLDILPIHRIVSGITDESFQKAKKFIFNKFKVFESNEQLIGGRVRIQYNNENFVVELIELNSDAFWNNDIYRLNTQILSQAFRIFDNSGVKYISNDELRLREKNLKNDEMLIETFPIPQHEFIDCADNNCIMPPKSTWFAPKFPSFLIMKQYK